MKRRVAAYMPPRSRLVQFRDIPGGTIALDLEGFWGVVVKYQDDSYFAGFGLDRWDAPPMRCLGNDLLVVPYTAKPVSKRPSAPRPKRPKPVLESESLGLEVRSCLV